MDNNEEAARTLYCGNLDSKADEELLYELFIQAGPLQEIKMPQDRYGCFNGYCFVIFQHECSVPYAMELFEDTELFGKSLKLRTRGPTSQKSHLAPSTINYAQMDFDALLQLSKDKLNAGSSGEETGLQGHSRGRQHTQAEPHSFGDKKSETMLDQDATPTGKKHRRSDHHYHSRREREAYSHHGYHGSRNQFYDMHSQESYNHYNFEPSNDRYDGEYPSRRRSRDKYHHEHGNKRSIGRMKSKSHQNT